METEQLRHALELADQQVRILDTYLHHLIQRQERSVIQTDNDFSYVTIKLQIMSEIKKLYEHYRDLKQEQFQKQCTIELAEILNNLFEHTFHNNSVRTSASVFEELDIHEVPSLLSPIDDSLVIPDYTDFDTSESFMDIDSDLRAEQLRDM